MRAKEMIVEELKEVQKYFENMSGGSCPLCILEAIEYFELKEGEENAN